MSTTAKTEKNKSNMRQPASENGKDIFTKSCSQRWKEEFRCSNFGLEYQDPSRFIRFEWGWPKMYLIWRGVVAVYHVAMILMTGFLGRENWTRTDADSVTWFIYLTHWMFLTLTLCTVIELVSVLYTYQVRLDIGRGDAVSMPIYLRVAWVWQNLTNNVSVLVTMLFWALLYKPGYPLTNVDVITHAGNVVYVVINLFITASPVRFYHFFHTFISAVVFIVFSVIYQMAGGTNGLGKNYIYSVLDWSKPGRSAIYACLSAFVGVPFVQMLLLLVFMLRVRLYQNCPKTRSRVDIEMENVDSDNLQPML